MRPTIGNSIVKPTTTENEDGLADRSFSEVSDVIASSVKAMPGNKSARVFLAKSRSVG